MNTELLDSKETLYDPKDAAAYLKLSPKNGYQTIKRWAREGRLRAGRAGDLYRFRKQDLDDFLFLGTPKRR